LKENKSFEDLAKPTFYYNILLCQFGYRTFSTLWRMVRPGSRHKTEKDSMADLSILWSTFSLDWIYFLLYL